MALIQLSDVTVGFRGPALLENVTCQIEPRQRIGLMGRNGAGKTTFMRILLGELTPDHGRCELSPGVTVALLPQEVPQDLAGTVGEVVRQGYQGHEEHHDHDWKFEMRVERLLNEMELDGDLQVSTLSAGMKRRVLLAQQLACNPSVLLLDEPTNHLDIAAINWLEAFLERWPGTLLFVTHDRAFLKRLANRILEIDRGHLFDWSCDYETFLVRKEAALATEEKQNALFDKKLAQEEAWIRQGIKARRTRNEGRVRALKSLREKRADRREVVGKAKLDIQTEQRSGALVARVEDISFSYGDRMIVDNFATEIMRGDKIGVIGPNGVGKSTLLRLLLGKLQPQSGSVRLGTNLQVAYFDQLRGQLDEEKSVQDNVGEGSDQISIGGKQRHVLGYLQDFLFTPDRARTLVRFLSGGERNRVLLAKLFSKPANIIVLDEPTNDLDAETLELLEEQLIEFPGTLLIVSHDRVFLNNVVTSTIVFEEAGPREYVGGYDDWLRQRNEPQPTETSAKERTQGAAPKPSAIATRRLSYQEQRELASLPAKIEKLETEIADLHTTMAKPEFYKQPAEAIAASNTGLKSREEDLAAAYVRWEELETGPDVG
ncbi:ATP-binding cassette domain-containing protein [Bythopirellula polymerisocia]|uniref:ATP-binding protein Uup n=1 Tax=Bythopirellula polymerisocia TaxID=2528003 RepID=A0A5C6CGE4_9BACT|nr:ATP-binding cassette domain-containing protein [Bythopirellula polymerisocia]TWU22797.1 ABC transporter ATP-binding protein uup [Bythopirellula polymerisocia]